MDLHNFLKEQKAKNHQQKENDVMCIEKIAHEKKFATKKNNLKAKRKFD